MSQFTQLQLRDYAEGYRFQVKCKVCGYGWYLKPADLLNNCAHNDDWHANLYLDEVESMIPCPRCKKQRTKISPLPIRKQHHFIGGMV